MVRIFLGITLLCLFLSCDSNIVVSENRSLPNNWAKDEAIQFTLPELDSIQNYDVFINLRNSNEYPFNNIFLIVTMEFPHGKTLVDTLEYKMAYPDGSWMGHGIGDVKENKLWYKENVTFFEKGNYNITITHAVRNNGDIEGVSNLEGVTDVGYSIELAKPD